MNMTAGKVLTFLIACFLTIAMFSVVAEKIAGDTGEVCLHIGSDNHCLKFFTVNEMLGFEQFKTERIEIAEESAIDSALVSEQEILEQSMNSLQDSIEVMAVLADKDSARFWLPDNNRKYWNEIFSDWENLENTQELYRILHHGDSQIEMDRMTAYIRSKLQSQFGGSGPGLLPPLQTIPANTVQQSASTTWRRYISYGLSENRAGHKHYGASGMIFNFDSGYAHVNISARMKKDSLLARFETVKVITGRSGQPVSIAVSAKNNKFQKVISATGAEQLVEWDLTGTPSSLNFTFTGDTTAEILGIAIDGKYGIAMDNIPWRGSSGTTFTTISKSSLINTYRLLNVKMVIMQFGGNSVPYIKTEKAVQQYVAGFKKQINYIRSVDSTIKILVIGPADMSYNDKGEMATYPLLEQIVEEMRKAANESGAAFWSMYHAMGGRNSMVRWVKTYPALAAPDYIHFTPKGSDFISQVFYQAIEREYQIYTKIKSLDARP